MQLVQVTDKNTARRFLQVNIDINRGNPNYIRPLDKDVNDVFDAKKNKAFRHGEAVRWILVDNDGSVIGRIAAFVNKKYRNKGDNIPVGGIGFFECIHDQSAADMLFDVAKHWLRQRGMEAMDGPINFGERDRWWGLLVEGFDPPIYCLNYNPPYYRELFETYGFRNFFNQYCYAMAAHEMLEPKFFERHAHCASDPNFSADHIRKNHLEKFAEDFTTIYNKAWAGHGGLKQVDKKFVLRMFRSMRPVMDEMINWFAYYKGEPIGFWINLPDVNQWFRHLNGKFDLFHKLKFLWIKSTMKSTRFIGLVFGVVPEFQGRGVDAYIIVEGAKRIQNLQLVNGEYRLGKLRYQAYEMQWIGEFNPKMINVVESLGTYRSRVLTTYRYLFDPTRQFTRHPIVV